MANSMSAAAAKANHELNNLWWVVAFALVFFGVFVFPESWIAGLMLIGFGVAVSPFVFAKILAKLSVSDPFQIRVAIVLLALASSTYVLFTHSASIAANAAEAARLQAIADEQAAQAKKDAEIAAQLNEAKAYFAANRDSVLAEFAAAVDSKNLATATVIRNRFIQAVQDPEFDKILNRYAELKEQNELIERQKVIQAKIAKLSAQLASVDANDYDKAISIYSQMLALEPENNVFKQKLERFNKLRDAKVAKEEAKRAADLAKAEHQKKIEVQFSAWDGSHRKFERMIKESMNDPDSYDHVETRYSDKGSYIRVSCTFRGRNAFGGMVMNTHIADFSIDGDFIKLVK